MPGLAASFQPLNPDFEARVRDSFACQNAMELIGATLGRVEPGYVEIELVPDDRVTQQHGYVHGGVVGMIADSAAGDAAFTLFPAGATVLTVEYKINLMAPAAGEKLVARGRVVKPGRTLTVAEFDVVALQGGAETASAHGVETLMRLDGKPDGAEAEPV